MPNFTEKLSGFWHWYHDLYNNEWYIEAGLEKFEKKKLQSIELKDSSLKKFKKEIENCQKCSLGKTRTNFVFGVGNEKAELMFVGEAPGKDEDLQGIPFVGRAGQLLNRLLKHIHLNREDVYIANILKCRPPKNRDPLPEEVEKCLPYLHKQIELVNPKLLVALGKVAGQNLLKSQFSLSNLRKRIWQYQNIPLIVTFHPAYILRYPAMLDEALEDMKFIKKELESLHSTG
ncbi:MAG: uracil-DNA glycosylase [Calditrichaeota bacterium]|nr:MAG: uracil-DNA glycosylase [Calditrichota bacterium]